mmetsp:Transcript_33250/g.49549  ORF Transcript_33250/g.49549 Transcript_33250/m.49549 type:complete len:377 (-) Transcript_33250:23-1153(-)
MGSDNEYDSTGKGSEQVSLMDGTSMKSIWRSILNLRSKEYIQIVVFFMLGGASVLLTKSIAKVVPLETTTKAFEFPAGIENNIGNFVSPLTKLDTAIYWHIPKASGSSMKNYYGCMGLVTASQVGLDGHEQDTSLQIVERFQGQKFVNVDTTKLEGIARAKKLGFAQSQWADIAFTPFPKNLADIFTPRHKGRFFALFRHPVDRAVSLFSHRSKASWEKKEGVYMPELQEIGLENYLKEEHGNFLVDNGGYMVSLILDKDRITPLTEADIRAAKEILRVKFLVGLTSRIEESVERFDRYFGWSNMREREQCGDKFIHGGKNVGSYKKLEEGSDIWNTIAEALAPDIQLYEYAVQLFEEQRQYFPNLSHSQVGDNVN